MKYSHFTSRTLALTFTLALFVLLAPAARASENTFNLIDFGAVGDGQTDDGPALQSALDALANAGGGILEVPAGRYAILTPVSKNFAGLASSITIRGVESSKGIDNSGSGSVLAEGLDLTSEFAPMTGETGIALSVSGLQHFLIKDIAFIGAPGVTDAKITLALDQVEDANIRHCEFYGLISRSQGGAIVLANRSRLTIELTKFLGSSGYSAVNVPVVQNTLWKGIVVKDSTFLDYGLRPELFGKTGMGTPLAWVAVGGTEPVSSESPRREAAFDNVFFDEAALAAVFVAPQLYPPASPLIDLVHITGLRMNVSNVNWWGNYFFGVKSLLIEKSRYEWSHNADAAININNTNTAILDSVECNQEISRIRADASTERLFAVNSVYEFLDSEAQSTEVINTDSPEQDPVQYVRQQFQSALNRAPDPAAHFYWSDRILSCGADQECVGAAHNDLAAYLATSPSPKFAISGRIVDLEGNALSNFTVSLAGSLAVTAQTDAAGQYRFADLPTSGSYQVSVANQQYAFSQSSFSFTNPSGDQVADFTGTNNKFAVAGRIIDAGNNGIAGIEVALTGAMSATTKTNANGEFSFAELTPFESYTITPSHDHHTFQPSSWTIAELVEDHYGEIVGTRYTHDIQGRVATAGGNAIPEAQVTLSGSQSGSAATDSLGNYSFADLPAGGNYTIAVAKPNYAFTPESITVSDLESSEVINFTGGLVSYTISGCITSDGQSLAGVSVSLSGAETGQTITDANGNYSFSVTAEGSFEVVPSRTHYTFSPERSSVANLSTNEVKDFVAILDRHVISGRVTKGDGAGLPGVAVDLSGSQEATAITNTAGHYSFSGLPAGGDYIVTLAKAHYTFSPQEMAWSDLSANEAGNFTAELLSYQISGTVTIDGRPLPGVTFTVSGTQVMTTTGDDDGTYLLMLPAEGNYTITPSSTRYVFTPAFVTMNSLSGNSTGDFVATLKPGVPVLISEAESTRALAFDSVRQTPEPFQLSNTPAWSADGRTRVMLFAMNFELAADETVASITVEGEDGSHVLYPLTVEYVGTVPGHDWLNCIVVRLDDNLGDVGDILVRMKYRGISSNRVRLAIGHIGGGLPDDGDAVPTPGRAQP